MDGGAIISKALDPPMLVDTGEHSPEDDEEEDDKGNRFHGDVLQESLHEAHRGP